MDLDLKNARTTLLDSKWFYVLEFEKYSNYLTGFGMTLSVYNILDLDLRNTQHYDYPNGIGLTLLNTGLGLINQPSRDVVTKFWRFSWINRFLPFKIVLIHAAFTTQSFGKLCMMIYLHPHYCAFYAALDIACHSHICQ